MSRIKQLVVTYPSGNTTALIFDDLRFVNRERLNNAICQTWQARKPDEPKIEQCGFVTKPDDSQAIGRLDMLGGEFCGNATRSAVWLLTGGKDSAGLIEASGSSRPLQYSVKNGEVSLEMPLSSPKQLVTEIAEGLLVQLEGIAQLVVLRSIKESPRQLLKKLLADNRYKLCLQPAIGVTYYDPNNQQARFAVWVRDVNTLFDETACSSGTAAIGIALASLSKRSQKLEVVQPSSQPIGVQVELTSKGKVRKARISGPIKILYEGEMELI
jgi:diaminopimelate epimerase